MKIKVTRQMSLVGCRREDEIAREWMWNHVEYGWEKV
jgi:hypothetical protein